MKKTTFNAGVKRHICVNRKAIQENLRAHKEFPTIIVVENGVQHQFHACNSTGLLKFDPYYARRTGLPAVAFIETEEAFDAFLDTNEPKFVPKNKFRRLKEFFFGLPVVSCLVN